VVADCLLLIVIRYFLEACVDRLLREMAGQLESLEAGKRECLNTNKRQDFVNPSFPAFKPPGLR
jgi:hypothetical protein